MNRVDRNRLAADVFALAWDRESNLPASERLEQVCGAMLDVFLAEGARETASPGVLAHIDAQRPPIVVDQLAGAREARRAEKAWPVAAEVALKHVLEVADLMGRCKTAEARAAAAELAWRLSRELRLCQRDIAQVLACSQNTVGKYIKRHQARLSAAAAPNNKEVSRVG